VYDPPLDLTDTPQPHNENPKGKTPYERPHIHESVLKSLKKTLIKSSSEMIVK